MLMFCLRPQAKPGEEGKAAVQAGAVQGLPLVLKLTNTVSFSNVQRLLDFRLLTQINFVLHPILRTNKLDLILLP